MVIHTLMTENVGHQAVKKAAAFLEKRGNNIDNLKEVVLSVLRKTYPNRFVTHTEESVQEFTGDQEAKAVNVTASYNWI